MKTITVFQDHLLKRTLPFRLICQRLSTERSTIYKWANGQGFPHRVNAGQLIELFSEIGVQLDYNDIYQPALAVPDMEVAV